ncbi:nuclear GTPase SLIP-GC-like [Arapaima gigas]
MNCAAVVSPALRKLSDRIIPYWRSAAILHHQQNQDSSSKPTYSAQSSQTPACTEMDVVMPSHAGGSNVRDNERQGDEAGRNTDPDLKIFPIEQVTGSKKLSEREKHWKIEIEHLDERPDQLENEEVTPKRKNGHAGGPSPKKRRKKKKRAVFSREIEDILNKCEDAKADGRMAISQVDLKIQKASCSRAQSIEFLKNLKKKISNLKEPKPADKIYIGLFGRTGAGKSSLINAIVNESQILPSAVLHACTSVCVCVQANTESDKYKADIEFMSKEDWELELRSLLEILSSEQDEQPGASNSECNWIQKMAEEKIKAVYGEDGPKQDYDKLVGNKQFPQIPDNCKKPFSFDTAKELSRKIGCYIRSDKKNERQYWPLVKRVTISLPHSPALLERIVLVDLPGAGDANKYRDEMWKQCLSQCASVWIVNDITRALSDKEVQKIFQESLRSIAGGGECQNITFVCTKTDIINPEEFRNNYDITDQDLDLDKNQDSEDYDKKEKQACICRRNEYAKMEIEKDHKDKVEKLLFGDCEKNRSGTFFNVFTVSSSEYKNNKQGKSSFLDENITELPALIEHIKKLYVSHLENEAKDYVSEISGLLSYLQLANSPSNDRIKSFTDCEFHRLKNDLEKMCDKMNEFLTKVHSELKQNLQNGVKAAEKESWKKAKEKVIEPIWKDFRGYHKTLKALCKNSGYFRSSNGDIVDLNYTLSEPLYAQMNRNNVFLRTFGPRASRHSVNGNFESFQVNFITARRLEEYRMEPAKYLRLVYIKTEQRKLLRQLDKEIVFRKKCIYSSLSDSIRKIMQPTYSKCAETVRYNLRQIQEELNYQIYSSKNAMFKEAMNEMLKQMDELKDWIVSKLNTQMLTAMTVALNQIPDDFVDLPDVREEFEWMKVHCDALDLEIFV